MSYTDNRTILQKADLALASDELLQCVMNQFLLCLESRQFEGL